MSDIIEVDEKLKKLKEELLLKICDTDNKNYKFNQQLSNDLMNKINSVAQINNDNKIRIDNIQDFNTIVKVKVLNNYNDFSDFKTNTSEGIYSQSIQVSKLEKELTNIINKFDKVFIENLILPGQIGENYTYKNLREYLEVSFTNLNK